MSSDSSSRTEYSTSSAYAIYIVTGDDATEDLTVEFRYHGRNFVLRMSLAYLYNSPKATSEYLKYISAIIPSNDGEFDDITDTEGYEWLEEIFKPLFLQLAPDVPPSFDPEKISKWEGKPLLSEYFFPETFGCRLEARDEKFIPIHVDNEGNLVLPRSFLYEDVEDELKKWTPFIEPSQLEVVFKRPEQTLYSHVPRLVLADLDNSGVKTLCFFKHFGLASEKRMTAEIMVHQKVHDAKLGPPELRVSRLQGIVYTHHDGATYGLLLSLIDHEDGLTLQSALTWDKPSRELRERWASQVSSTVEELHKAGAVWGDVKTENVLIDKEGNAWVIDFEGGYTEGWVDKDKAGTQEGDLQGLGKLVDAIWNTSEP